MAKKKDFKKILSDTYVNDRNNITEEEAVKELTNASFIIRQILKEKEEDTALEEAKLAVKDLNAGYNSAIKFEKAKIEFLLEKIEEARALKAIS